MNVLANFSDKNFEESKIRLNESALKFGINRIESFGEEDLKSSDFYKQHSRIFSAPKGFGYWAWKPYFIHKVLSIVSENDIVFYSDCGIKIIKDLTPLKNLCEKNDIVIFANDNLKNRYWTKRDCFVLMDCDTKLYWNGKQADAAFCIFKNNARGKGFVTQWLQYCCDERIISDNKNVMGKMNFWKFHEHRWDQSVLSLLALKWDIELFRQPTQYGNHYKSPEYRIPGEFNCVNQLSRKQVNYYSSKSFDNSPYFQLLDHHRKRIEIEKKESLSLSQSIVKSGKRRVKKIIKLLTRQ